MSAVMLGKVTISRKRAARVAAVATEFIAPAARRKRLIRVCFGAARRANTSPDCNNIVTAANVSGNVKIVRRRRKAAARMNAPLQPWPTVSSKSTSRVLRKFDAVRLVGEW